MGLFDLFGWTSAGADRGTRPAIGGATETRAATGPSPGGTMSAREMLGRLPHRLAAASPELTVAERLERQEMDSLRSALYARSSKI